MDLSKFFDRVQHDGLLARVARKVRDKRLLRLIGRYLRAGVMVDADLQPSTEGTMQGGPLSPLLANILLDDFDKELERRGHRFVRYADDFLVFTKTSEAARRVYRSVGRYLTRKLKLVVTHGISSKGPWVMSSSQAVHQALSVDYLSARGLASLLEIWMRLAAKKRTAQCGPACYGGVGGVPEQSGPLSRSMVTSGLAMPMDHAHQT
jgi:RNA-directed DNA polymerase